MLSNPFYGCYPSLIEFKSKINENLGSNKCQSISAPNCGYGVAFYSSGVSQWA
jgi:hypothetical protein